MIPEEGAETAGVRKICKHDWQDLVKGGQEVGEERAGSRDGWTPPPTSVHMQKAEVTRWTGIGL